MFKISAMTVYSGETAGAYIPIIVPTGLDNPWANYRMLISDLETGGGETVEAGNAMTKTLYNEINLGGTQTEDTAIDANGFDFLLASTSAIQYQWGTGDWSALTAAYATYLATAFFIGGLIGDGASGTAEWGINRLTNKGQFRAAATGLGGGNAEIVADGIDGVEIAVSGGCRVKVSGLPVYADEAAALAGGLTANTMYRTSTGEIRIKL